MTETENQNSEVDQVAPVINENVNEINEVQKARQEADERNWKAMRTKNAELEKRLQQREEMLDKMMNAQLSNQAPPKPEIDEFDSISDEEFIPKGKVKQLVEKNAKKYAEQIAEQKVEEFYRKQQDSQYADRIARQYPDYLEIVNPETLSLLQEKEPELAKMIGDLKDPYKIGMQAYKYIKAMGYSQKATEVRREKEIEKAIEKSEKSIPSPASHDKRPIAQAFQLTDAMKKDLYREMHGYASMANSVPEMT
jgi:hypothetical protein